MQCAERPFEAQIAQAEVIFLGKIEARTRVKSKPGRCWDFSTDKPSCGSKVAMFTVERAWKGSPATHVDVVSEDGCYCLGSYFEVGDHYLVFARRHAGIEADLRANNICFGTRSLSDPSAQRLIDRLNKEFSVK